MVPLAGVDGNGGRGDLISNRTSTTGFFGDVGIGIGFGFGVGGGHQQLGQQQQQQQHYERRGGVNTATMTRGDGGSSMSPSRSHQQNHNQNSAGNTVARSPLRDVSNNRSWTGDMGPNRNPNMNMMQRQTMNGGLQRSFSSVGNEGGSNVGIGGMATGGLPGFGRRYEFGGNGGDDGGLVGALEELRIVSDGRNDAANGVASNDDDVVGDVGRDDMMHRYHLGLEVGYRGVIKKISIFGDSLDAVFGISATHLARRLSRLPAADRLHLSQCVREALDYVLLGALVQVTVRNSSGSSNGPGAGGKTGGGALRHHHVGASNVRMDPVAVGISDITEGLGNVKIGGGGNAVGGGRRKSSAVERRVAVRRGQGLQKGYGRDRDDGDVEDLVASSFAFTVRAGGGTGLLATVADFVGLGGRNVNGDGRGAVAVADEVVRASRFDDELDVGGGNHSRSDSPEAGSIERDAAWLSRLAILSPPNSPVRNGGGGGATRMAASQRGNGGVRFGGGNSDDEDDGDEPDLQGHLSSMSSSQSSPSLSPSQVDTVISRLTVVPISVHRYFGLPSPPRMEGYVNNQDGGSPFGDRNSGTDRIQRRLSGLVGSLSQISLSQERARDDEEFGFDDDDEDEGGDGGWIFSQRDEEIVEGRSQMFASGYRGEGGLMSPTPTPTSPVSSMARLMLGSPQKSFCHGRKELFGSVKDDKEDRGDGVDTEEATLGLSSLTVKDTLQSQSPFGWRGGTTRNGISGRGSFFYVPETPVVGRDSDLTLAASRESRSSSGVTPKARQSWPVLDNNASSPFVASIPATPLANLSSVGDSKMMFAEKCGEKEASPFRIASTPPFAFTSWSQHTTISPPVTNPKIGPGSMSLTGHESSGSFHRGNWFEIPESPNIDSQKAFGGGLHGGFNSGSGKRRQRVGSNSERFCTDGGNCADETGENYVLDGSGGSWLQRRRGDVSSGNGRGSGLSQRRWGSADDDDGDVDFIPGTPLIQAAGVGGGDRSGSNLDRAPSNNYKVVSSSPTKRRLVMGYKNDAVPRVGKAGLDFRVDDDEDELVMMEKLSLRS
ncbi:hypothetical protein HDU76_002851 [Blyttiomyces sp. JEL0837]|nr:hypothetical protein HDU76_002851 [Blyttiomyces sp. JEL0837]